MASRVDHSISITSPDSHMIESDEKLELHNNISRYTIRSSIVCKIVARMPHNWVHSHNWIDWKASITWLEQIYVLLFVCDRRSGVKKRNQLHSGNVVIDVHIVICGDRLYFERKINNCTHHHWMKKSVIVLKEKWNFFRCCCAAVAPPYFSPKSYSTATASSS